MNTLIPITLTILCAIFGSKYLYKAVYIVCTMIYMISINREYQKTNTPGIAMIEHDDLYILTGREKETAHYLYRGYTYKETAASMHISLDTVRSHTKNIYEKLNIHSRKELYHLLRNKKIS